MMLLVSGSDAVLEIRLVYLDSEGERKFSSTEPPDLVIAEAHMPSP
jgi:hypothetical protein